MKKILFSIIAISSSLSNSYAQKQDTIASHLVHAEVLSNHSAFTNKPLFDSNDFNTLDDVINRNASVYVKDYGAGQLSTLSIRGNSAVQTQVFWNGFNINPPNVGQSDLSLIPSFFVSSINMNMSGASTVNGSGGIGGSLDLKSSPSFREGFHVQLSKEFSSFTNQFSSYGLSYGKKSFYNELKVFTRKGINDYEFVDLDDPNRASYTQVNNELNQKGIQYNLGYWMNPKNLLSTSFQYVDSWREIPPYFIGATNNEFQVDKQIRSFLSWKSYQENIETDVRIGYFDDKNHYTDSVWGIFSENDSRSFQAQARAKFNVFQSVKLETSLQHNRSEVKSKDYAKNQNRNETGLYLKASQQIKNFYYEAFARQELIDEKFSPLVFGAGIKLKVLKDNLLLKSNFSTNYRTPALNDLYWNPGGNLTLDPEKGWTAELGLAIPEYKVKPNGQFTTISPRKLNVSITGFYNKTNNWIQWQPTPQFYWSPQNVKSMRNMGIETEIKLRNVFISKDLKFNSALSYTYTDSRNIEFIDGSDDLVDKTNNYVPAHRGNFLLAFSYKKMDLDYSYNYTSIIYINDLNTSELPHYSLSNVGLSYRTNISKLNLKFGFRVNNMFDLKYRVVSLRPQMGRTYVFNAKFSF